MDVLRQLTDHENGKWTKNFCTFETVDDHFEEITLSQPLCEFALSQSCNEDGVEPAVSQPCNEDAFEPTEVVMTSKRPRKKKATCCEEGCSIMNKRTKSREGDDEKTPHVLVGDKSRRKKAVADKTNESESMISGKKSRRKRNDKDSSSKGDHTPLVLAPKRKKTVKQIIFIIVLYACIFSMLSARAF